MQILGNRKEKELRLKLYSSWFGNEKWGWVQNYGGWD